MLNNPKNYWEESRYVFMSPPETGPQNIPEDKPKPKEGVDKLAEQKYKMEKYNDEFKTGEFLSNAKKNIIDAISNISKVGERADMKGFKEIAKAMQKKVAEKAFARLAHLDNSYQKAIQNLDKGLHDSQDNINKVRKAFQTKVSNFENKILERFGENEPGEDATSKIKSELRYADWKEKMDKADSPEKLQSLKADVITYMLKAKGYKPKLVEAMSPYISNRVGNIKKWDSVPKLQKYLQDKLDKDGGVMKDALADMIKDSPRMVSTTNERNLIKKLSYDNLKTLLGKKADRAVELIGQQLHIEFDDEGNVMGFVDMAGNGKLETKGVEDKIKKIVEVRFENLGEGDKFDKYEEDVNKTSKAHNEKLAKLQKGEGIFFKTGGVEDINALNGHKGLTDFVDQTKDFREGMAVLKPFKGSPKQREMVAAMLNNKDAINVVKAANKKGMEKGLLTQLLEFINKLMRLSKGEKLENVLKDAQKDVEKGEDVVKKHLAKSKAYNEKLLSNVTPQPKLNELLNYYKNPDSAKKLFEDGAMQLASKERRKVLGSEKDIQLYSEGREDAIKTHLTKQLKKTLDFATELSVSKIDNKISVLYKTGTEYKSYFIESAKDGKLKITNSQDAKDTRTGTLAELKKQLQPKAKVADAKEGKEKPVDIKTKYKNALIKLAKEQKAGSKTSELGEIIRGLGNNYKRFDKSLVSTIFNKKRPGTKAQKQEQLDNARIKHILSDKHFKKYEKSLKAHTTLAKYVKEQSNEKSKA